MKLDKTQVRKPYFVRFLEQQELAQASAGKTLKYPSDNDEEWTLKFPSDDDE